MNVTGVIKRIDHKPYSSDIVNVVCFCEHCDPEGKGEQGGLLKSFHKDDDGFLKKDIHYCPTCGRTVNWNQMTIRHYQQQC